MKKALASIRMFGYIQAMGKIKSAWEIALERTEGIQIDKDKMKYKADVDNARRLAGRFVSDDEPIDEAELREGIEKLDSKAVKEALLLTAEANLSLPQSEDEDDTRLKKAGTLIDIATGHDANALALTEELEAFLKQYPLHRKDLIEKMKAQYKPVLDEKSDKLSKQYGTEVHLTYENDKEFMELARQNLERLEAQYNATLANAKKQLRSIAGLNAEVKN